MNKLFMIVLMASAMFAFPGCRSHHHDRHPRPAPRPVVHPHPKAAPHAGYHKAPPPSVRPVPAPGANVPPPRR